MADGIQAHGERTCQFIRRTRPLVHKALHAFALEQRDGRHTGRETAGDRQRLPAGVRLVLGETEGVFAGPAQCGAVGFAGPAATDIALDQLQRAADGGVGAVALAQRVEA